MKAKMPSATTEDYLKKIYEYTEKKSLELCPLSFLSEQLSLTPGTVTTMLKRISADGFVDYFPRKGCSLTEKGRRVAMLVVRKHRILELFLVDVLGMDWSEVHEEAEILEHSVSVKLLEKIDDYLGNPRVDPHGHEIPYPHGEKGHGRRGESGISLDLAEDSMEYEMESVDDEQSALLKLLGSNGMYPGCSFFIDSKEEGSDTIAVKSGDNVLTLSLEAAKYIKVRRI